jgi:uncharacterized protein
MIDTCVVIAKEPVPGRVKTRLTPAVAPRVAADLAAAALTDTLDAVNTMPTPHKMLAFDGRADNWLRPGWHHCVQPSGGLDRRLSTSFRAAGSGPTLLIGMDTPQITAALLTRFDPSGYDACLGPARDGGYWCIGLRDPSLAPAVIDGVPMSTAYTYAAQLDRLRGHRLRVQILGELVDVDTVADARAVAELAPWTAFAATWTRLTEAAA